MGPHSARSHLVLLVFLGNSAGDRALRRKADKDVWSMRKAWLSRLWPYRDHSPYTGSMDAASGDWFLLSNPMRSKGPR